MYVVGHKMQFQLLFCHDLTDVCALECRLSTKICELRNGVVAFSLCYVLDAHISRSPDIATKISSSKFGLYAVIYGKSTRFF